MSVDNFKSYVLVNPNSCNGRTGKLWPELSAALEEKLGPFEQVFTSRPREATDLAREALGKGFEMIVSVGGDGTHNEVVNGFFDGNSPIRADGVLGIVTSGTGGDLRKSFGIEKGPDAALERLGGRETRPIDVGHYTYVDHEGAPRSGYFVNILSFGIGGLVDMMVNSTTKALGGKASFFMGTLRALARYRRQVVKLSLDGGPEEEVPIHNVAVANGRFFGGGMMVAPEAEIDDGLFDIVGFVNMSTWNFISLGSSIYKGSHIGRKNVTHARARTLRATSDDRVLLDVDGEQPGMLPLTIENVPSAIRMKV